MDIRFLAMRYALSNDPTLRKAFAEAAVAFTDNLPFMFEEEKADAEAVLALKQEMEGYQIYGNQENYRMEQTDDGVRIFVEPPEHIKARNQPIIDEISEKSSWLSVYLWAQQSLEKGEVSDSMPMDQAVNAARAFQRPDDFSTPYAAGSNPDNYRLEAIVGVAAAIVVTHFEWAQEHSLVDWSRSILIAAARMPSLKTLLDSRHTNYTADVKVSAGRGLGALIEHGAGNEEVEQELLSLINDPHLQVVRSVFTGLYGSWNIASVLCWNAFSLCLSLCLKPRRFLPIGFDEFRQDEEQQWIGQVMRQHVNNLKAGIVPSLPQIAPSEDVILMWDIALQALLNLPMSKLLHHVEAKTSLLQLADELMDWTINENRPDEDDIYRSLCATIG